jgi:hypothetical protein
LEGREFWLEGVDCRLSAISDARQCEIIGGDPGLGFIVKVFRSGDMVICKSFTRRRQHFTVGDMLLDCRRPKCVVRVGERRLQRSQKLDTLIDDGTDRMC